MFNRKSRHRRRLIVVAGMMLLFAGAIKQPSLTAYAAENNVAVGTATQTSVQALGVWEPQADGTWKVKAMDGSGYILNRWYQDADGSWYYLNSSGVMFAGIVIDDANGKAYLMNTDQSQAYGSYGKMLTVDGAYTIKGITTSITFNHLNDGTNGAITSQESLAVLINAGVPVLHINTTSGTSTGASSGSTQQAAEQPSGTQTQGTGTTQTSNSTGEFCEGWMNKPFSEMTQAELDRYEEIMSGGGSSVAHPDDMKPVNINWG